MEKIKTKNKKNSKKDESGINPDLVVSKEPKEKKELLELDNPEIKIDAHIKARIVDIKIKETDDDGTIVGQITLRVPGAVAKKVPTGEVEIWIQKMQKPLFED